jgi:adenylate cyclase class 2
LKELEVKFYIGEISKIGKKLIDLGAELVLERTHEYNLRFDTPEGSLSEAMSMLRLRRDIGNHLTFKGPTTTLGGVLARKEVEFDVSDFELARKFVESLGFTKKFIYEKYRTTYDLRNHKVTLDEMPYGNFIEIEGPEAETIKECADDLELNWDERLPETYVSIFQRIKDLENLKIKDLTFANFQNLEVRLARIGIQSAIGPS